LYLEANNATVSQQKAPPNVESVPRYYGLLLCSVYDIPKLRLAVFGLRRIIQEILLGAVIIIVGQRTDFLNVGLYSF